MPHPARIRPARIALALLFSIATVLAAPAARAHEYWLAPSRYDAPVHSPVELSALAGTGFRGERKPFVAEHCVRLVVRAGKLLDLEPVSRNGELTWARFVPVEKGGALFAYQSDFTPITLPAAEFDRYLGLEGLDGPLAVRKRSGAASAGRERFRRCAKAWCAGDDATRATTAVGLPLEIVPLATPGRDASLRVRVLWQGKPLAGALLRGWRAATGKDGALVDPEARDSVGVAWQARTDTHGDAVARVTASGEWLLSVVHMVPSTDAAVADWESTWASLTFERTP